MSISLAQMLQGFAPSARRKLTIISGGWALVALIEALAYTVLGFSIANRQPPLAVIAAAAVAITATVLVSRGGYLTGAGLAVQLYQTLGEAFARAKLAWFTETNRAFTGTVAGSTIPFLMSVPAHQLQTLIVAPLLPLFVVVGMWIVADIGIAGGVALLLVVSFVIQFFAQRTLADADAGRAGEEASANDASYEFLDHLELLRTALGSADAVSRTAQHWEGQRAALRHTNRATMQAMLLSTLIGAVPTAGVLLLLVLTGTYDAPMMLAIIVLTLRAAAPLEALAIAGLAINDLRNAADQIRAIREVPVLPEPASAGDINGHSIEIRNVTHAPSLQNVSVSIPEGSTVSVQGPTGSGKSTLLSLLMRFDDPDMGSITIGGADLRDLHYDQIAAQIAYVPQNPDVFSGTLADNIRIGNPEASDAEVIEAARQAALETVIAQDLEGIQQQVGHRGNALSGGERQRVAIARALLRDSPILILDEATSALDIATERHIAQALSARPSTVILVTHRDNEIWSPSGEVNLG